MMDEPTFKDVALGLIKFGKENLRFGCGATASMTLRKGCCIFHQISGRAVDYFVTSHLLRYGFLTTHDTRKMIVDAWEAFASSQAGDVPARRITRKGTRIYYRLSDRKIARICASGVKFYKNSSSVAFWHDETEADQTNPDMNASPQELLPLLRQVFRVSPDHEMVFATILLAFFDPNLVSPLLVLLGSRGTSKTTTSRQICSLVSPTIVNPLVALPSREDALLAQLTNSYITAFDNVAFPINPRFADILCQFVTGSTYAKRKLYCDNEKLLIPLQGKAILNGIDEIASKDDFAERCCVVNLAPIPPEERLTDTDVRKRFESVKPRLLGCIFNTLSAILANKNTFSDVHKPRMAEFFVFGLKAMEAIGENPDDFAKAYLGNVDAQVADAEARLPIVRTVMELFHKRGEATIRESPTNLARYLNNIAQCNDIKLPELTPESVTKTLKKNAAALLRCGYELKLPEGRKNKRFIELTASDEVVKSFRKRHNPVALDNLDDL